jgi:hypothetical protein
MVTFRHCEIQNFNTDCAGGTVPLLLDCIVHDCGSISDDDDHLLPCASIYDYRYNNNCEDGLELGYTIGAEFCVFYKLEYGFICRVHYRVSLGPITNSFYLNRNTFVDITQILEFSNPKHVSTGGSGRPGGFTLSNSVTSNIDILGKSNAINIDLFNNILNGANLLIYVLYDDNLDNVEPMFLNNTEHNYRLVQAGMTGITTNTESGFDFSISDNTEIQRIHELIPIFDSPGIADSANSAFPYSYFGENLGAYQDIIDVEPKLSYYVSEFGMPEKTNWELTAIREESNDGLFDVNSSLDYQYNKFNLKYEMSEQTEGNKITHLIRLFRSRNEPVLVRPFNITVIPPAVESSRKLQSQMQNKNLTQISNYHNWLNNQLYGYIGNSDSGLSASNVTIESWQDSSYVDSNLAAYTGSLELSYSAIPAIIDFDNIDMNWFIGFNIVLWDSTGLGENRNLAIGKITNVCPHNPKKIYIEYKYAKPFPSIPSSFDRVFIRPAFWQGLISFADVSNLVPSSLGSGIHKLIYYIQNSSDYGLRFPIGLQSNISNYNGSSRHIQGVGSLDSFLLSICNENASYSLDMFFQEVLDGVFSAPATKEIPFLIGGGSNLHNDKYVFRLESKNSLINVLTSTTNVPDNQNWEFYDLIVLHPENPFNWSSFDYSEMLKLLMAIYKMNDYLYMASVDSFIANIQSNSIKNESPDKTFFEAGSEWSVSLDQWNQYGGKRNTWKNQEFSLIQRRENRQLQPFRNVKHPLLTI